MVKGDIAAEIIFNTSMWRFRGGCLKSSPRLVFRTSNVEVPLDNTAEPAL